MKRLISLILLTFILSTSAVIAAESRLVKLRVLDRGRPQEAVKVLVNYPDGNRTAGTTVTLTSNSSGVVEFALAGNVFWVTVPSLNDKVIGEQFDIPENAPSEVRLDIRPREWRREVKR